MSPFIIPTLLLVASSFATARETTYEIDSTHTATVFSWDHLGYSTPSANFKAINGEIIFDDANIANSTVNVTIDTNSINTNIDMFDDKLQGSDWFNAIKFPNITFKSTAIKALGNNQFQVDGTLMIKGIEQNISLQAKLNKKGLHPMANKEAIGFNATTQFNRSEFDMGDYVPAVSDQINVNITVEAIAKE